MNAVLDPLLRVCCSVCNIDLPLRYPLPGEHAERFRCAACGTSLQALWRHDAPPEIQANARRECSGMASPRALLDVVQTLQGNAVAAPGSRRFMTQPEPTPLTRRLDELIDRGAAQARRSDSPFFSAGPLRGAVPYDARVLHKVNAWIDLSTLQLQSLHDNLATASRVSLMDFSKLADEGLRGLVQDLDMFVALCINKPEDHAPARHSINTAMLAMAMGAILQLDKQSLLDLGIGCLIHDAGMLRLDQQLHELPRTLPVEAFGAIQRHPIQTLMLIERHLSSLSLQSRLVIYQMHERCDGSGYPRGVTGQSIHPLAKIASIADSYLALVSPRPHRPGLLPYHAIRHLLNEVRSGLYDPDCMRALLKASSLFPLGSYVRLSDGRLARVIRANGPSFDRPVVGLPTAEGSEDVELLDLLQTADLHVEGAASQPVFPG